MMYDNGRGTAPAATRRPEPRTRRPEPIARRPEPGTRRPEPGTRRPEPGSQNTPKSGGAAQDITLLVLAIVVNIIVLENIDPPVVRPVLGFWFVLVLPSYLLFTTSVWRKCTPPERLGYSVAATIFLLMAAGLAVNEILP